jgi:hypothetical protein
MATAPNRAPSSYRIRATLKNGKYQVNEGASLERLKKKATELEKKGAYGYIEHTQNHRVMHHFGQPAAEVSRAS